MIRLLFSIIIIIIFISSCSSSKSSKKNINLEILSEEEIEFYESHTEEPATVIATIALQNMPFNIFHFKITQIFMVNSMTDEAVALTSPNNQLAINHSAKFDRSELIAINQKIPSGIYDRVIILITMDNSLIVPSNKPDGELQFVDVALNNIPEDRSDFEIEAYIGNHEELVIEKDSVNHIEFSLDIDTSTKYIPLPNNTLGVMFNPKFIVKTKNTNKKIQLNGLSETISEDSIKLTHFYKVQPQKPERTINYSYTLNNSTIFHNGLLGKNFLFLNNAWTSLHGELLLSDKGFSINIDDIFLTDKDSHLNLFQGSIISNKNEMIKVSGFYNAIGYTKIPILKKLINKNIKVTPNTIFHAKADIPIKGEDIKAVSGQTVLMTISDISNETQAHSLYIEPSKILAEVSDVEIGTNTISIKPLSYNNADRLSSNYSNLFDSDLILTNPKNEYNIGELINITGYQLKGDNQPFFSIKETLIPKSSDLIFSISTPTVAVFNKISQLNNQSVILEINKDIYTNNALSTIRYPQSNAQYRGGTDITAIIVDASHKKELMIAVLIDGTNPIQSLSFSDTAEFIQFIEPKINDKRYLINEIVCQGVINENTIKTHKLSIVLVDTEKKQAIDISTSDDDDDDNDNPGFTIGDKAKNILITALPIFVPLGVTLGVSLIFSTISGTINFVYSGINIKAKSYQIKNHLQAKKLEKIKALQNIIDTKYDEDYKEIIISDDAKAIEIEKLLDVPTTDALKTLVQINIDTLQTIDSVTRNDRINELISIHSVLESYIDGYNNSDNMNDKIINANTNYKNLVESSAKLEADLKNFIDKSLIRRNASQLADSIQKYTNDLHKAFIIHGDGTILKPKTDLNIDDQKTLKDKLNNMRHIKLKL